MRQKNNKIPVNTKKRPVEVKKQVLDFILDFITSSTSCPYFYIPAQIMKSSRQVFHILISLYPYKDCKALSTLWYLRRVGICSVHFQPAAVLKRLCLSFVLFQNFAFLHGSTSRINIQVTLLRRGGQERHWRDAFFKMSIDLVITCFNCIVEGKGTQLLFCGQRNTFLCLETIPNTEKNIKFYNHLFKGFKCKLTMMYSAYASCHLTESTIREK